MDTTYTTKALDLDSIALDSSPVIAAFLRCWNDSLPDDELERYVPLVVGTNRGAATDGRLAWMVTDWLVRVQVPAWLRLAGLTGQAEVLEGLPEVTSASAPAIQGPLEAVRKDAAAVRAAAWDAAWDAARAAWDAAWDAASDATRAAARAAAWAAARAATRDATMDAATDVACAAAWDAACAAAWDAADVRVAARAAATAALDPTTRDLQAKAHDLLDRMITVASEEHG